MSERAKLTDRIDVRVDDDLAGRIREEAQKQDRSDGAVVRRILREHFADLDRQEERVA